MSAAHSEGETKQKCLLPGLPASLTTGGRDGNKDSLLMKGEKKNFPSQYSEATPEADYHVSD